MSSKTKFKPSDFICLECGNVITLQRLVARQFPQYNERSIWCPKCKKKVAHLEVQNADIIKKKLEFNGPENDNEKQVYQLIKKHNDKNRIQL